MSTKLDQVRAFVDNWLKEQHDAHDASLTIQIREGKFTFKTNETLAMDAVSDSEEEGT